MLSDMLKAPPRSRLRGAPMRLADVVAGASSREDQSERIEAYWALMSAVADYYLGLAEVDELARLRESLNTYDATLGDEQSRQVTRVETSLRAAQAAQVRLGKLIGRSNPLPADTPFCGPYRTRFEQLFPNGDTGEAGLLNALLPLRLADLEAAYEAVRRSESWILRVKNDPRRTTAEGLVRALELVALNRRAVVQLARDYNLQINRYTELVAPERVDTPRLVAMLIRTPSSATRGGNDPLVAGFSDGAAGSANRTFGAGAASRR